MKFNLSELESLFADIQDIIDFFEYSQLQNREITLFLSNGEKFNYKVPKESVAHLLGINTTALIATGLFKNTSSYELLKEVVNNAYRINNLYNEGHISYNQIFSEHILDKVKIFKDNIKTNIYTTEFVCKYDSKRSYDVSIKNEKCDYIVIKKNIEDNIYTVLTFVKNSNNYYFVPMSSLYFNNEEELNQWLKGIISKQEITLLNGMSSIQFNDNQRRFFYLPLDLKITKLGKLKEYKKKYGCEIDILEDFKYALSESIKHLGRNSDSNILIQQLIDEISSGKLINIDKYDGTNLYNLASAFNDYLCVTNINNSEISESYSSVVEERNSFKDELLKVKQELEETKNKNEELVVSNQELIEQNKQYSNIIDNAIKVLRPSK
ncbi:MAG: hypothetical protein IJD92_04760 [Bacilli bacterium]|nr:hypothetical protein [Bacilli bacterium]